MTYLENVMRGLSTLLYNASQNPSVDNCNNMLDSIKRTLVRYEEDGGTKLNIVDHRK